MFIEITKFTRYGCQKLMFIGDIRSTDERYNIVDVWQLSVYECENESRLRQYTGGENLTGDGQWK